MTGSESLSRLKGIETRVNAVNAKTIARGSESLSRLKGIETSCGGDDANGKYECVRKAFPV